jgi:hypothetical protein
MMHSPNNSNLLEMDTVLSQNILAEASFALWKGQLQVTLSINGNEFCKDERLKEDCVLMKSMMYFPLADLLL